MANEEVDDQESNDDSFNGDEFEHSEMPWESEAREAIEHALDDVMYDEIRGVIYAATTHNHRGDAIPEEFGSIDELLSALIEIGEEQWYAYVPYDDGPVFEPELEYIAQQLASKHGVIEFFDQIKPPGDSEQIGSARDLVLPQAGLILRAHLGDINDELIRYLAKHPEHMQDLTPRKFEELVAALFRAKGYDVELTPATRDGGFDMRAFHRTDIGTCLTLIECKRYDPKTRVSVDVVRGLYGVTESERATTGLVVTTSSFTRDAKSFRDRNKYRIQLADQQALREWLREHNHHSRFGA